MNEPLEIQDIEWIHWSPETNASRPDMVDAVNRFKSLDQPAGDAAAAWLRNEALASHPACRTHLLLHRSTLQGFYAVTPGEVELRSSDQKTVGVTHPRAGAVLVIWLARAAEVTLAGVGDHLLLHAVGAARRGAEYVGGAVIALDPFDEPTAELWQKRGFKNSRTRRHDDRPPRMWQLLPPR